MKICLLFLIALPAILAQKGTPPVPKNLKILAPGTNIPQVMDGFRTALGTQCTECHVQGDFSSDDNPTKSMARNMMRITADLNKRFADGKSHVTCYTCHRGETQPRMEVPPPPKTP